LAGAEVIVAQGMEAGGHRGCFDSASAEARMVGLFSLIPAIADAVRVPVVATGGIADGRGAAAALLLGASAAGGSPRRTGKKGRDVRADCLDDCRGRCRPRQHGRLSGPGLHSMEVVINCCLVRHGLRQARWTG
jgi:hypothetical protein